MRRDPAPLFGRPYIEPKRTRRNPTPLVPYEDYEQKLCAQYLDARGACWFHVPNGEKRDRITAAKLRAMGVKRGVCDIWILDPPPGRFGLVGTVIELKRVTGVPSDVSPEQRDWLAKAKARFWSTHVANGFDEMRAIYDELYGREPGRPNGRIE